MAQTWQRHRRGPELHSIEPARARRDDRARGRPDRRWRDRSARPEGLAQVLGGGPAAFGLLMVALGIGAAIGVVTLLWLQRRLPREAVFTTAVVAHRRGDHRGRVDVVARAGVRARGRARRGRGLCIRDRIHAACRRAFPTTCAGARSRRCTPSFVCACCCRSSIAPFMAGALDAISQPRDQWTRTSGRLPLRAAGRAARALGRWRASRSCRASRRGGGCGSRTRPSRSTRDWTFIVLEGGEGVGKSTQARLLAEQLTAGGFTVDTTREPGGTPEGIALRQKLLHGADLDPLEELDAFLEERRIHVEKRIRPNARGRHGRRVRPLHAVDARVPGRRARPGRRGGRAAERGGNRWSRTRRRDRARPARRRGRGTGRRLPRSFRASGCCVPRGGPRRVPGARAGSGLGAGRRVRAARRSGSPGLGRRRGAVSKADL